MDDTTSLQDQQRFEKQLTQIKTLPSILQQRDRALALATDYLSPLNAGIFFSARNYHLGLEALNFACEKELQITVTQQNISITAHHRLLRLILQCHHREPGIQPWTEALRLVKMMVFRLSDTNVAFHMGTWVLAPQKSIYFPDIRITHPLQDPTFSDAQKSGFIQDGITFLSLASRATTLNQSTMMKGQSYHAWKILVAYHRENDKESQLRQIIIDEIEHHQNQVVKEWQTETEPRRLVARRLFN